jgi:hypothetical protein
MIDNVARSKTMGVTALKREDLPHYTYDDYVQWEGRWEKKDPFRDGKMVFEPGTCEIELDFGAVLE